jgi:diguanylate cyclase (GGDEF)-like protein
LPELLTNPMHADFRRCCESKEHFQRPARQNGLCSHLFPVLDGREVVYLLEISTPSPLRAYKITLILALLSIYCNLAAMLNSSDRDELTGLRNRRTFGDSFKRLVGTITPTLSTSKAPAPERRRAEYVSTNVHLAVIDIDFFKRINDQFGHPYGDEVLVLLARLMGECFRESDVIFRFGGEEFLVILPNTDFQDAEMALERFREQVEAFYFSQVGRVTVSIGFTTLLTDDSGPAAFGRADQALYVAKHSGRNQVQWYELLVANGTLVSATKNEQDVEMF